MLRRTKILVVDEDQMFRNRLQLMLHSFSPSTSVIDVGSVAEADAVLAELDDVRLVILDLNIPDGDGIAVIDHFQSRHKNLPILVLTTTDDPDIIIKAIDNGASSFLSKEMMSVQVLQAALLVVLAHGVFLSPFLLRRLRHSMKPSASLSPSTYAPIEYKHQSPIDLQLPRPDKASKIANLGLTPREGDVLQQILQGKSVKLIARSLGITDNTAKAHVSMVLRALHVNNRTQAVIAAMAMGL